MALSPCTLGMMDFLGKPSIHLSTHRTHTTLSTDLLQLQLAWWGLQQERYLGNHILLHCFLENRTEIKTPWHVGEEMDEQHLANSSPACKADCMRKQSLCFASFLSTTQGLKPISKGNCSTSNQWQWAEMFLRHCSTWSFATTVCRDWKVTSVFLKVFKAGILLLRKQKDTQYSHSCACCCNREVTGCSPTTEKHGPFCLKPWLFLWLLLSSEHWLAERQRMDIFSFKALEKEGEWAEIYISPGKRNKSLFFCKCNCQKNR